MSKKLAYRAKWVIPVCSNPIRDGVVEITNGRVTAVLNDGKYSDAVIDLGESAILPALVNAHTHLEFSDLAEPLGEPGIEFADWILAVVGYRIRMAKSIGAAGLEESKRTAIKRGLAESAKNGVGAIGEIATFPFSRNDYRSFYREGGELTLFLEQLGRDRALVDEGVEQVEQVLTFGSGESAGASNGELASLQMGISPHAPYSVHPEMLSRLISLAGKFATPVAMHLAETRDELELMWELGGALVATLESLGAWYPESYRPRTRPLDYLKILAGANRSLVIHGNYLSDNELGFLADRRETMSVVYCPRTHHFFGHDFYRLDEKLRLGVAVAIGTDSRASNPDLSLMAELRFLAFHDPELTPETILRLGTVNGAKALGLAGRSKGILVGGKASLAVVTTGQPLDDPYSFLYSESADCRMLAGRGKGF